VICVHSSFMHPVVTTEASGNFTMLSIGETSLRSGVSIETIRYYEREGIVPAAGRTASGRRAYIHEDVARLRFVRRCRDLGFSIADVRSLMKLSSGQGGNCELAAEIARAQLQATNQKLGDLERLEEALSELLKNCESGRTECHLLATLFAD